MPLLCRVAAMPRCRFRHAAAIALRCLRRLHALLPRHDILLPRADAAFSFAAAADTCRYLLILTLFYAPRRHASRFSMPCCHAFDFLLRLCAAMLR